jgi:hypothetical protein
MRTSNSSEYVITAFTAHINTLHRTANVNGFIQRIPQAGLDYHVISVFGSQSTGKSTLLNALFHTKFDTMDEVKRQQTTRGIWLGYTKDVNHSSVAEDTESNSSILIMDVEGSDGRERGEDQDFERKAALFALATSEVLIINIWEHQVGLYQGANMALLKTVFEVNLTLFGNKNHKTLLLFVIRDHVGTPLENLSNTLTEDLNKMWNEISKPSSVSSDVKLSKYFDLEFVGLSHKLLQPDKFVQDVKSLGDRFLSPYDIFQHDYKQQLPMDGWAIYAQNCWDQITSNKDLDLPTQQILVARFRCDEIVKEAMDSFDELYVKLDCSNGMALNKGFQTIFESALSIYDSQASHYNKTVYESKRIALIDSINQKLISKFKDYVKDLKKDVINVFKREIQGGKPFLERSIQAKSDALNTFNQELSPFADPVFGYEEDAKELETSLDEEIDKSRTVEIQSLTTKITKKMMPSLKNNIIHSFQAPDQEMWDRILDHFNQSLELGLEIYVVPEGYDFKLGCSNEQNQEVTREIKKQAWLLLDQFVHEYLREDSVVSILRRQFEDLFTYDSNSVPRIWKTEMEISTIYKDTIDQVLKSIALLSLAKLSNDSEIIPDVEIDDDGHRFAHIFDSTQQLNIKKDFLRHAETAYRDANRSIVTNVAKIPPFIYVLLLVLGWNEFMTILRNPLYLILAILIGTGLFFVHTLNLWGPLDMAFQAVLKQVMGHLASVLLDDRQGMPPVGIEMEDLSRNKEE